MQIMCRKCECKHVFVRWTRKTVRGIVRGRECRACGYRFTTREIIEKNDLDKDEIVTDM